MSLSATIKAARLGRFSQAELAMCLGMSQPNYSNIERGITEPTASVLFILSRILGLDLSRFVNGVDVLPYLTMISQHRTGKPYEKR